MSVFKDGRNDAARDNEWVSKLKFPALWYLNFAVSRKETSRSRSNRLEASEEESKLRPFSRTSRRSSFSKFRVACLARKSISPFELGNT